MSIPRILILVIVGGLAATAATAQDISDGSIQKCVDYEPSTVTLTGTLSRRSFVNVSDHKEIVWVLKLAKPICVNEDGSSDFNVKRERISVVQLALDPEMFGKYRRLLGKKIKATGTLFGEHTAHHFTPVLLDVSEINLARLPPLRSIRTGTR